MALTIKQTSFLKEEPGRLPDFIIIGGMKCGTTSLHYYLNCHPDISMSREKELNFFIEEKNWHKGIEWYQSKFTGNAKIYGEASPNYTYYPNWQGVPERLYSTIPHAKLIYILRDPIERIISHYVHRYADGRENCSITEVLADFENNPYNPYVCRSRYYWQLEQYLRYFPSSNILILTSEQLEHFPQKTLQTIFRFLAVSEDINLNNYQKKLHKSIYKRRKNNLGNAIAELPIMTKIDNLHPAVRYNLKQIIYFPFSAPVNKPQLTSDLQSKLVKYFQDDINRLREYTGYDFTEWSLNI
ncbi:MAG: sulfotransferase [Gloeocapsa sp. DLM2.Bin57]|nr:MAG: sulfotransferase [Gloeocapsa sp. DLM2.Bin57]